MKLKASSHYARILAAQKLLKARDESKLTALRHDLDFLEQENSLFATMMTHGSHADFVDPLLLAQKMERNRRTQSRLADKIEAQITNWLQSSRRVDRMAENLSQARSYEARNHLSKSLDEIIAHSLVSVGENL